MSEIKSLMCTKHGGKAISISNFYRAPSKSIYSGIGYVAVCKDCIDKYYEEYLVKYKNEEEAIYYLCMLLDLPFSHGDYEGAVQHSSKTGWKLYQSFFKQLNSFGEINSSGTCFADGEALTHRQSFEQHDNTHKDTLDETSDDVQMFWGRGFNQEEYSFLEYELDEWKKTHKCDNQAELTLLKEICIKILTIRNGRERKDGNVSNELKNLQDLMKTASVDPAKANAISSGASVDRFGVWIKDIEQYRPAEWWDKQEKYVDMDGFKPYIENYITRPIQNFFTGVKNFLIGNDDLSFKE
ncbi:hypothetical protein ACR77J_08030 [Tissierella praeacuta]|uniref:hypothetical protein n=1 Tax=Tissierella praeacuta TaxID=43131 RepID=UPI003DA266BD